MAAATIVHDTSEAVALCPALGLYLKPITKLTISVALPQLKQPGKSISNWEVMERLKAMAHAHAQFSALRIAKSTMDFIRFEGEVENRALVKAVVGCLDGKTIKLSGFADSLRVRAAEFRADFPSRHDWDSFFRDAKNMNETLPGERPDTIHLEGLPCRWFAPRDGGGGGAAAGNGGGGSGSERPSEALLREVFRTFGDVRHVDIPMLDPYREEMTGRSFHTFSFGGHLNFEAYVQYREYAGFVRAMSALRGMKLMFKGDDGKAVACNVKVSFDSTKHLSDASILKRQLERQKLQELELQREEQKRREKEAEERQRAEERKQRELEEAERERRRGEKLRRREQRQREREQRRSQRRAEKLQAEEQRRLTEKIRLEERKLLLAQRNLQSIRLVAELLGRAKAARLQQREQSAERRRRQEAELRRVEEEKRRALGLQRRERELRQRLVSILLSRRSPRAEQGLEPAPSGASASGAATAATSGSAAVSSPEAELLRPVLDMIHSADTRPEHDAHARPDPGDDTREGEGAARDPIITGVPETAPPTAVSPAASTVPEPHAAPVTRSPSPVDPTRSPQQPPQKRVEAGADSPREAPHEQQRRRDRDKERGRKRSSRRRRRHSRSRSPRRGGAWTR